MCLLVQRNGIINLPLRQQQRLGNRPLLRQQGQLRPDRCGQVLLLQ